MRLCMDLIFNGVEGVCFLNQDRKAWVEDGFGCQILWFDSSGGGFRRRDNGSVKCMYDTV